MKYIQITILCLLSGFISSHVSADLYDKMSRDEIHHYMKSNDKCTAKHANQAMKTGITSYNNWQRAYQAGKNPPKNAFRDGAESFEYLVKSGCTDGWLYYRYAMVNYMKKRYKKAMKIMHKAEKSMLKNYPDSFIAKYYMWAGYTAQLAYSSKKISTTKKAAYTKKTMEEGIHFFSLAMKYGKHNDVSAVLNYAGFLKAGNCIKDSEKYIKQALRLSNISSYAKNTVIPGIRTSKVFLKYCKD